MEDGVGGWKGVLLLTPLVKAFNSQAGGNIDKERMLQNLPAIGMEDEKVRWVG